MEVGEPLGRAAHLEPGAVEHEIELLSALAGGPRGAADELALLLDGEGVDKVEGPVVRAGQRVVPRGGQLVEFLEPLAGLEARPAGQDLGLGDRVPVI